MLRSREKPHCRLLSTDFGYKSTTLAVTYWLILSTWQNLSVEAEDVLCGADKYYDGVDRQCINCSDICNGHFSEFCRINCPEYYAKHTVDPPDPTRPSTPTVSPSHRQQSVYVTTTTLQSSLLFMSSNPVTASTTTSNIMLIVIVVVIVVALALSIVGFVVCHYSERNNSCRTQMKSSMNNSVCSGNTDCCGNHTGLKSKPNLLENERGDGSPSSELSSSSVASAAAQSDGCESRTPLVWDGKP
jgi:hypothetical protein